MRKIIIIILLFFLSNNLTNINSPNTQSKLIIQDKEFSCTFSKDKLICHDIELNKHYNINILQESVILSMAISDIDYDGTDEILIISAIDKAIYGNDFIIYKPSYVKEEIIIQEIYRNDFTKIKPWEIQVCNLDDDNIKDIYVGVYKSTPMFHTIENRPFFFNFDGEKLIKKWTGSKLEHSFSKIKFFDLIGNKNDELIVIEKLDDSREVISVYYWLRFGFVKFAESYKYDNISDFQFIEINNIKYIDVFQNNNRSKSRIHLKGNKFIE